MSLVLLLLAGLCYAAIFWAVTARRPAVALLLIFASAPFQNDISGGGPVKFSLAEINLLLSVPLVMLRARRWHFGATLAPALAYLAVCVFSGLGQWRLSAPTSLVQICLYTVVAVMIFASLPKSVEDYRLALNGAVVVGCFFAVLVVGLRTSYILGMNKNGVGASLAASFTVALALWLNASEGRQRTLYLGAAVLMGFGCFMTLSRGAWLAALIGALTMLTLRRRFGLMLRCGALLVPVVAVGWFLLPQESRAYATGFSSENNYNIKLRYDSIDFAWRNFVANPLQGVGIGLRKDYDATNIVLMTLAETGVPGLVTFLLLHLAIVVFIWRAYRKVAPGTYFSTLLALALALVLGKFLHGLVDHYWSRGSLTMVWASVGMAVRVAYEQKILRRQAAEVRAIARWEAAQQELAVSPIEHSLPAHQAS